jgi:hypothetical protein
MVMSPDVQQVVIIVRNGIRRFTGENPAPRISHRECLPFANARSLRRSP